LEDLWRTVRRISGGEEEDDQESLALDEGGDPERDPVR
jgi:hypothetical protein